MVIWSEPSGFLTESYSMITYFKEELIMQSRLQSRLAIGAAFFMGLLALGGCKKPAIDSGVVLPKEKPTKFPYELMDGVQKKVVNDRGRVDYTALKADHKDLDTFVAYVGAYGPKTSPELFPTNTDKQAYYIDAYNAFVMSNVLSRYPIDPPNIDKIKINFFVTTKFKMDGADINLNQLETDIVRPVFKDPRNHFALNCGARGCPQLPQEAFVPERLDEQLNREAKKFVSEERNVKLDGTTVYVSDIVCSFYPDDFVEYEKAKGTTISSDKKEGRKQAIVTFINRYRAEGQALPDPATLTMKCIPYNWTPNDQALKD
jgi:hypothetical protein